MEQGMVGSWSLGFLRQQELWDLTQPWAPETPGVPQSCFLCGCLGGGAKGPSLKEQRESLRQKHRVGYCLKWKLELDARVWWLVACPFSAAYQPISTGALPCLTPPRTHHPCFLWRVKLLESPSAVCYTEMKPGITAAMS